MTLRLLPFLLVLVTLGAAVPVAAQDSSAQTNTPAAPGLAYASLFIPVPAGTPITVRPWDNSAENQRVKASFTNALTRLGVPLADRGSNLMLNFETEVESLAAPRYGDSRLHLNLGTNPQDEALTGQGTDDDSATTRYVLRATLDDQRSGERLWQGEAHYTAVVNDETSAFVAMAPILASGFGKNLQPKPFRIQ